jgi:hypothetical protein
MVPIVFEEHSCEDNELENTVVYHACAVTLSMEKPPSLPVLLRVSYSFCALISRSLVKRPLLTYLIVYLRTGSSLIDLWTWTVSSLSLTHDSKMIEHLAVKKNSKMILAHCYRPNIRRDVAEHCRSCNICQVMGKPNQNMICIRLKLLYV